MTVAKPHLTGRESELRTLAEHVDAAGERRGGIVVVRGPAGIGKSSILDAARSLADQKRFQILATSGVEAESHLPFASLHQLLRPFLRAVDGLPESYAGAIRSAFGLAEETHPSPFLIALATLHLLSDCSETSPVLLLIDDAQWLDRSTADALAFLARRLESDPILLVPAFRDGFESPLLAARFSELSLERLSDPDAASLLDQRNPRLAPAHRDRVLRDAVGNPLALVELAAALATHAGPPPATLPLTNRLERAFTDRLASLTPDARGLLHVAAIDENGLLSELLSAASRLVGRQVALEAATEAADAALVRIEDQQLLFRHPLMRSAIQQAMSLQERQTAHAALADTLEDNQDRRVWHRAGAELGSSEMLAADLEGAARRAADSGGNAFAFRAMERAARMTEDPTRRGARLIRAAHYAYSLGWVGDIRRLIEGISDLDLTPTDRTELAWLREILVHDSWSGPMMITSFAEIADRLRAEGEVDRGLQTLLRIAVRCWWSNPDVEARAHMIEVAERFPVQETDADLIAVLALAEPVARGATVLDRLARRWSERDRDNRGAWLTLGMAAFSVGDFVHAERFLEGQMARCRARGYLGALVHGLVSQAWTKLHRGDWKHAASLASEAKRLADETGMTVWDTAADLASATVAAYRGEVETADTLAVSGERALLPRSANPMLALVQLPRGVAALAAGRFDEAYHQLRRIFDPNENAWHPHVRSWALVDLVEAAVHSGHDQEAAGFVQELESVAARSRWPLLLAALEYARPVLADDADDDAFQAGLRSQCADWPFMRARLQFAYGLWLRRQRRSADARAPLRAARDAFDALGAIPWGERARQELRASGETSRRRSYDLTDALSPQELQIARLAAAGLTNKEIGQQVFLSHRTVASHLYRTFPKLGITARSHLRAALEGDSTPRPS